MSTSLNTQLAPNKPDIVSEKFEDEYILVSLVNGNYYSLRGTAAGLWTHIEGNCNAQALMNAYVKHFDLTSEQAKALEDFLHELIDQNLVKTDTAKNPEVAAIEVQAGGEFEIPVVEAYSDMQDLLLLDPIHDVDEKTGWPAQPDAEESKEG
ncbi:MAG: hypothetical protein DRI69_03500 [Bacteroidetes bacterium]|nr:MAG: hypothetical protein DRI69_03500 [Bacteroidota bacterium]